MLSNFSFLCCNFFFIFVPFLNGPFFLFRSVLNIALSFRTEHPTFNETSKFYRAPMVIAADKAKRGKGPVFPARSVPALVQP